MRAALLVEPGRIVLDELPDPVPGLGEVRVAVGGVGLCGSDLSVFSGKWAVPAYPWIMGHEAFGVVDAVGPGVAPDRVGETVVVEPNVACFECVQCRRGWTSACVSRQSLGMNRPGAFAEHLVVPGRLAWAVPATAETDLVCAEPATVVAAALRRLMTPLPEDVLVMGVGAQGLMMTLTLVDREVAVHAQDLNPVRVDFAAELGAIPSEDADPRRFELVVDTVGSPASMEAAIERIEVGGALLCLGLDSRPFGLSAETLVRRQLTLQGSLTYDHPTDFAATIAEIMAGRFAAGRIVTDEYPLDRAQEALERGSETRGKTWLRIGTLN